MARVLAVPVASLQSQGCLPPLVGCEVLPLSVVLEFDFFCHLFLHSHRSQTTCDV